MKYVDFVVQSGLMLLALVALGYGLVAESSPMAVIVPQFYIGIWQMVSALLCLLTRSAGMDLRRLHVGLAIAYLATLTITSNIDNEVFSAVWLTVPAWSLAIFYYRITWRRIWPARQHGGSFLPHINF